MRYAGLKLNDATNCDQGIVVSFWVQGCPHKCAGCHNPETWSTEGGKELPANIKEQIIKAISANGVQRNFSVLGGEPLFNGNSKLVLEILNSVRASYPKIRIFLWTGYLAEDLFNTTDTVVQSILEKVDVLIDGPFQQEKKDLTIPLRGSKNQRVWERDPAAGWIDKTEEYDKVAFSKKL